MVYYWFFFKDAIEEKLMNCNNTRIFQTQVIQLFNLHLHKPKDSWSFIVVSHHSWYGAAIARDQLLSVHNIIWLLLSIFGDSISSKATTSCIVHQFSNIRKHLQKVTLKFVCCHFFKTCSLWKLTSLDDPWWNSQD